MFEPSAFADSFARDNLPPLADWPEMDWTGLPELAAYPKRMNAAAELLDRMVAEGYGDSPCLRYGAEVWTYRDLLERANRIANVLVADLEFVTGNRVLLRAANNPMMVACWFAVLKAGGIAVATMPLLRAKELVYQIDKARVSHALCDIRLAEEMELANGQVAGAPLRTCYFYTDAADGLEALMADQPAEFVNCDTAWDDVALVAFTSGSTGSAKGTMHFHRDVLAICDCFPRYVLQPRADDIFCGTPPLAFTFGLGGMVLFPMRFGGSTVLTERNTAESLLQTIQDYRCTIVFTAPTMYRVMAELAPRFDLGALRQSVSAGETLPLPIFQAWEAATGLKMIDGLGGTEMLHIFITSKGDGIRPGATGKPIPGYRAKIVDADGQDALAGSVGRLAVQGPTGCRYLDDAERQRRFVQDGWNLTGDAYRMDEDGYFWYVARTDDMIVSAGYNISGPEVEATLLAHPKVLECAVVAAADGARGNIVKAFVVLRDAAHAHETTIEELQVYVKATIAPYKYPRAVEFVDILPKTESGKIQRFRLREIGSAELAKVIETT